MNLLIPMVLGIIRVFRKGLKRQMGFHIKM